MTPQSSCKFNGHGFNDDGVCIYCYADNGTQTKADELDAAQTTTKSILNERETQYGNYLMQCKIIDALMNAAIENGRNWYNLDADQRESIHMIFTKISRILNGDKDHEDSWRDISGYATLVADRIKDGRSADPDHTPFRFSRKTQSNAQGLIDQMLAGGES